MRKIRVLIVMGLLICMLAGCLEPVLNLPSLAQTEGTTSEATVPTESLAVTEPTIATQPTVQPVLPWEHEAALIHLLQDTNHNGEYLPDDGASPPGSQIPVELIPQPDQSRIGETVSLILAQRQQDVPFYYCCNEAGDERLAVFIHAKIPMLAVFETELGGIQGLYSCIASETVFQGKILSMTNIAADEGNIYGRSILGSTDVAENELLTADTSLIVGECLGIIGTDESETVLSVVKGGVYESASDMLKGDIDWVKRIFKRYSLEAVAVLP